MLSHEEARYEEAARHDQFDDWGDTDADFEARCDNAIVEEEPPMNDEDRWAAWLDLQNDPEYRADFPKPDGVYCV
jgi:hypothetical protein